MTSRKSTRAHVPRHMKKIMLVSVAFSLLACDGSTVVEGERGPAGERGAQGPRGPVGPRGGVGDLIVRSATDGGTPGTYVLVTATCADDERAIAGGCDWGKGPAAAKAVAPVADADGYLVGWACEGLVDDEHLETIMAFVVCEVE